MPLRSLPRLVRMGPSVCRTRALSSFGATRPQPALPPRRGFSSTGRRQDAPGDTDSSPPSPPTSPEKVLLHFINRNGEKSSVDAKEGESLLEVVVGQNLNIDGFGACEGTLACSTCHLIFEEEAFRKLGAVSDEELDMLDLAFGLTDTSRLGCQVHIKKWMDGLTLHVPREVSDIRKELEVEKQSKQ